MWLIIIIIFIYYKRFESAKRNGTVKMFKKKIASRYLYALSSVLILFSIILGKTSGIIPEEEKVLQWEAVIMPLTAIMITPIFVRTVFKINKSLAVIFPILSIMLMVGFIPFSTGANLEQTIEIIGVGIISIFAVGYVTLILGFLAIFFLMMLIGLLSTPVVITI